MPIFRHVSLLTVPIVAALAACSSTSSADPSASGRPAGKPGAAACANGQIRFGVEPFEDPAKLEPAFTVLAAALEKKLGCPIRLQIVESYSAEVLAMQNGQLDMGVFGPLGYVFAHQRAKAEAVASFADASGTLSSYKAGIWVPKSSPVQTIADLKGKTLALSSAGSTSGDALPRYAIQKAGLAAADVKANYAGGHPQALLALVNGKVDAAEINTQQQATATKEGTFDPSEFRQIWASDPIPNDPITVSGSMSAEAKKEIEAALLGLTPDDVKAVGEFLDVEPGPLVKVDKATYQPLFDLATTLGLTEKDV